MRGGLAQTVTSGTALGNDAKYKKYKNHVEKTLGSFESVAEWADFITFLAKLLKVGCFSQQDCNNNMLILYNQTLQTYPQFTVIPHKLNVAKRLAQCLNPALPTGVHQRALDVYVHILNTIGVRPCSSPWSPLTDPNAPAAREPLSRFGSLEFRALSFLSICCYFC